MLPTCSSPGGYPRGLPFWPLPKQKGSGFAISLSFRMPSLPTSLGLFSKLYWWNKPITLKKVTKWFHLCDIPKVFKFIESQVVVTRRCEEVEKESCCLMGIDFQISKMERFWRFILQIFTIFYKVWIYLTLPNCTFLGHMKYFWKAYDCLSIQGLLPCSILENWRDVLCTSTAICDQGPWEVKRRSFHCSVHSMTPWFDCSPQMCV